LLKQARDVFKSRAASSELARVELEGGRVAELSGDLIAARRRLERARDAYARLGDAYGQARALNALGDVARKAGDVEASRNATIEALRLFDSMGNISGVADCLNDLAERSRLQGNLERARERAEEALRLYEAMGSNEQFGVRLNLAMIELRSGNALGALTLCAPLEDAFERAGQVAPRAQVLATSIAAMAYLGRWHDLLARLQSRDPALSGPALNAFGVEDLLTETAQIASAQDRPDVVEALNRLLVQLKEADSSGLNADSSWVHEEHS